MSTDFNEGCSPSKSELEFISGEVILSCLAVLDREDDFSGGTGGETLIRKTRHGS